MDRYYDRSVATYFVLQLFCVNSLVKTNERANKLWSDDYELGSKTKTISIYWR